MLFGKRGPRLAAARRRGDYRPRVQGLEERCLLAIDVGGVLPPGLPNIATGGGGFTGGGGGIDLGGGQTSQGAGFSVTDVGDTNRDGFDDFVIGGPTVVNIGGQIQPGTGSNPQVYLVLGSSGVGVTGTANDWIGLTPPQRVGDLAQLGNATQNNPISGTPSFPFRGVTFITASATTSQLGASVAAAGDVNSDGFADFLIGAPNHLDINGLNPGAGRAYLVFGSAALSALTGATTYNLDAPAGAPFAGVLTFATTIANSRVGRSVAGLGGGLVANLGGITPGGFLSTGTIAPDIAIGAPNASLANLTDNGAVYVLAGNGLSATTATINLQTVNNGGPAGVIFAGATNSAEIGFSVADAGDVDGRTNVAGQLITDLLIGAPISNSTGGTAYLVYGGNTLPGTSVNVGGTNVILVNRIGGSATNSVAGAVFTGSLGSRAGFAVAGIGDYNGDGFSDIAIGAPFFSGAAGINAGRVYVFYGQPSTGTTLTGAIPLNNPPAGVPQLTLTGAFSGDLAGYSISRAGRHVPNQTGEDWLIGAPGFNANQGAAYFIPANTFLVTGNQSLLTAESQPLAATLFQLTNTLSTGGAFFGTSVGGRPTARNQGTTADNDGIADFIIGAPGYSVTTGRNLAGGAFIIEGRFVPAQTPVNTAIQTQIGVGQAFGPFVVNATTPNTLQIFVFSSNAVTPPFDPVTNIDPTTIVVNGVPFPNAVVTKDPVDENKDGIEDAIVTITPRSRLNLNGTVTSLTITGRTLVTSPNGGLPFSGTATIAVSGSVTPPVVVPGGGGLAGLPSGFIIPTSFTPPYGPDRFSPPLTALSRLDYKALPVAVALQQFLPTRGFAARLRNFGRRTIAGHRDGTGFVFGKPLVNTLDNHVFDRSKFHQGKTLEFRHKHPVIPTNRQTERYQGTALRSPRSHH